jgi:hypothetical protein
MRALMIVMAVNALSGCILRSEDARNNPFGTSEATSAETNERIDRDRRYMQMMKPPPTDPNRGCGGCS